MKLVLLLIFLQPSDTIEVKYGDPNFFTYPDSLDYEIRTDLMDGFYVAYDSTWEGEKYLRVSGELRNNRKVGSWKYYNEPIYGLNHFLEQEEVFDNGFWVQTTEFYENGQPRWRFNYPPNAELESDWITEQMWYENGQLRFKVFQPEGSDTYRQIGYYENGTLQYEGGFDKHGRTAGTWTHYYENGQIEKTGKYCNSCLQKGRRPFFYGIPTGKWNFYDEDGNLTKTENFHPKRKRNER